MCGRYTLRTPPTKLAEAFGLDETPLFEARYNVAPTQSMPIVRLRAPCVSGRSDQPKRELSFLRWGLIPSWADDTTIGARLLNARSESVASKPAFRSAFRRRRCLVPSDGFYEWEKIGRQKHPFYITMKDGRPFAFAGLWEKWTNKIEYEGEDVETVESYTILTTDANEQMRPLHERMPVILGPEEYDAWLDPKQQDPAELTKLLHAYAGELKVYPVNSVVNSAKYDGPQCIEEAKADQGMLF